MKQPIPPQAIDWTQVKPGTRFTCEIGLEHTKVSGKIQFEDGFIFLCQDERDGGECRDKLGYKYSWFIADGSPSSIDGYSVTNLILLPEQSEGEQGKEIEAKGFVVEFYGDPSVGIFNQQWKITGDFIFENTINMEQFKKAIISAFEFVSDTPIGIEPIEDIKHDSPSPLTAEDVEVIRKALNWQEFRMKSELEQAKVDDIIQHFKYELHRIRTALEHLNQLKP